MWFKRKAQPPIRSLIGEGTRLQGNLNFTDGLRIDGEVDGDIVALGDAPNLLVISEKARVHGKVKAGHVIINGEVLGPVESTELLELQPKARVTGQVNYLLLEMHVGARVEGDLRPGRTDDRPVLTLASSKSA
ncbi:polymer-forming cytoskeletal protein [Ideonella sp. A 288]|uniref:bactofilin family protein n=1 Tax=Ideonella sp. A 288 TaxID=1962181 RepID=UPI000B4AEB2E|nr:polymer-forming cytoskeletal protein [Ideonella sp. A 288]